MGDPLYEERQRLKRENEVLRERKENARLKAEAQFEEQAPIILQGLSDLFSGKSQVVNIGGRWRIVPSD